MACSTAKAEPPMASAVVLVSLSARCMTLSYLEKVASQAARDGLHLDICLLDIPEFLNARELHGLSVEEASTRVLHRCRSIEMAFAGRRGIRVTRSSSCLESSDFKRFLNKLEDAVRGSKKVAARWRNQVFRNLDPSARLGDRLPVPVEIGAVRVAADGIYIGARRP